MNLIIVCEMAFDKSFNHTNLTRESIFGDKVYQLEDTQMTMQYFGKSSSRPNAHYVRVNDYEGEGCLFGRTVLENGATVAVIYNIIKIIGQ